MATVAKSGCSAVLAYGRKPGSGTPRRGEQLRQFFGAGYHAVQIAWTLANDWFLNIRTMPHRWSLKRVRPKYLFRHMPPGVAPIHVDMGGYQAPDYAVLRKTIRFLNPGPNDTVFDLGAGKGRIVCMFARQSLRRCVGIELSRALCDEAKENARRLRGRRTPVDIVWRDAAQAELGEGTIYVMFNPFGPSTLKEVLERIEQSLGLHPRAITVVYMNDRHRHLLEACPWLTEFHQMHTFTNRRISFWHSTDLESHVGKPKSGPLRALQVS
jgi:precorrin-6B methylase 2